MDKNSLCRMKEKIKKSYSFLLHIQSSVTSTFFFTSSFGFQFVLGLVRIELLLDCAPNDNFLSTGESEVLILERLSLVERFALLDEASDWSLLSNMSSNTSSLISIIGPKISSPFSSMSMSLYPLSS